MPATFLARHLDATEILPGSCRLHVEQEYASGVCVVDEILLSSARRLSKKTDMRWVCASHIPRWSCGSNWNMARVPLESIWNKGMRQGYAPPLLKEKEVCVQVCAQLCAEPQVPTGCVGHSSLKLGMRRVCANHISRSSSGSSWNTAWITPDSIWSKCMRQGYALGTKPQWASQTVSRRKRDMRQVCAGNIPRSPSGSEHDQDLAGITPEQGYASGVCAGQATPLALPKCLSTKTNMR